DRRHRRPRIGEEAKIGGAIGVEPRIDLCQRASREQGEVVVEIEPRREYGTGAREDDRAFAELRLKTIERGMQIIKERRPLRVHLVRVHGHDRHVVMCALDRPRHLITPSKLLNPTPYLCSRPRTGAPASQGRSSVSRAALVAQISLALEFDKHNFKRFAAYFFGQMLSSWSKHTLPRLHSGILRFAIAQLKLHLTVGDEYRDPVWMLVHDRFLFRPIRNLQDSHLVVFKHHLIVLRIHDRRVLPDSRAYRESSHGASDQ